MEAARSGNFRFVFYLILSSILSIVLSSILSSILSSTNASAPYGSWMIHFTIQPHSEPHTRQGFCLGLVTTTRRRSTGCKVRSHRNACISRNSDISFSFSIFRQCFGTARVHHKDVTPPHYSTDTAHDGKLCDHFNHLCRLDLDHNLLHFACFLEWRFWLRAENTVKTVKSCRLHILHVSGTNNHIYKDSVHDEDVDSTSLRNQDT